MFLLSLNLSLSRKLFVTHHNSYALSRIRNTRDSSIFPEILELPQRKWLLNKIMTQSYYAYCFEILGATFKLELGVKYVQS